MSILSDAWRRARGEEDAVGRALGAPPPQPGSRRAHWLPWVISCLLLIAVVGLSVYLWRIHLLTASSTQSPRTAAARAPVQATASGIKSSDGLHATHAIAATHTAMHSIVASTPTEPSSTEATRVAAAAPSGTAPDAVRAQLPPLDVTVHVWNPRPNARFIVANGRMYHEGDELAPGLSLVSITQDGEIVKFQGYLITLGNH